MCRILVSGATLLFQLSPALDLCAVREVARWQSSHLINSELAWPYWEYLSTEYGEATEGDGRRLFLRLLTDGLFRASYPGKVRVRYVMTASRYLGSYLSC